MAAAAAAAQGPVVSTARSGRLEAAGSCQHGGQAATHRPPHPPTRGDEALGVEEGAHPEAAGAPAVEPAVQLVVARQQARQPAAAAARLPADLGPALGYPREEQGVQGVEQLVAEGNGAGNGEAQVAQGVAHQRHHAVQPAGGSGGGGSRGRQRRPAGQWGSQLFAQQQHRQAGRQAAMQPGRQAGRLSNRPLSKCPLHSLCSNRRSPAHPHPGSPAPRPTTPPVDLLAQVDGEGRQRAQPLQLLLGGLTLKQGRDLRARSNMRTRGAASARVGRAASWALRLLTSAETCCPDQLSKPATHPTLPSISSQMPSTTSSRVCPPPPPPARGCVSRMS